MCAEDPRPSARNMGILGILLVSVMVGLIRAMGVTRFLQRDDIPKVKKKPPAVSNKNILATT